MTKTTTISQSGHNNIISAKEWLSEREEILEEKFFDYCDDFQHKVGTDTLSFREGALIFLAGGLACQIFIWFTSLFS